LFIPPPNHGRVIQAFGPEKPYFISIPI
jgi:hypothetical protein